MSNKLSELRSGIKLDGKTEFTLIPSGWDAEKITEFGQPHSVVRGFMDGIWEKIIKEKLPSYIED